MIDRSLERPPTETSYKGPPTRGLPIWVMTAMDHKLALEFSRVADAYHLKVSSRLGEAEADLVLPFSAVEERALLRALE